MTLIDSSAWIAYFTEHVTAKRVEAYFRKSTQLLVPSIVVYEVYRYLSRHLDKQQALFFVTQMQEGRVVHLDEDLALYAADLSLHHKLGLADAIIYATALAHEAQVVTLDNDFRNLNHCTVIT